MQDLLAQSRMVPQTAMSTAPYPSTQLHKSPLDMLHAKFDEQNTTIAQSAASQQLLGRLMNLFEGSQQLARDLYADLRGTNAELKHIKEVQFFVIIHKIICFDH